MQETREKKKERESPVTQSERRAGLPDGPSFLSFRFASKSADVSVEKKREGLFSTDWRSVAGVSQVHTHMHTHPRE